MDKESIETIGFICVIIIIIVAAVIGTTIIKDLCLSFLYGGKNVYCVEDTGVDFNATISGDLFDIMFYFGKDESGITFKSTDGKIYMCRGIAEIT